VLLLADRGINFHSNVVVDQTVRKILGEKFGLALDIHSEYLDLNLITDEDYPALLSWLNRKYSGRPFDAVLAVGDGSLGFVRAHQHDFFAGARIVFFGRKSALAGWESTPPVTGVVASGRETQVRGLFDFIRKLQPDVEQVVIVSGAESADMSWETAARRELALENRIGVTYLAGLTVEETLTRLEHLPRKSAILFLTMNEDAAGSRLSKRDLLALVVQRASAPVYTTSSLYLDLDIVGGALLNQEQMAVQAAGLIADLLRDETLNPPLQDASLTPMVNWRALRRWGIRENVLPEGTVVVHRDPSIWALYRWRVIGVLSLCIVEGALIVALLVHRARRKRAEKDMEESRRLLQSSIDALDARVALMDQDGKIVAANQPWLRFSEGQTLGVSPEESQLLSEGVWRLMSGELKDFRCVYPLQRNGKKEWFQVRMRRFYIGPAVRLVVAHEDVTEIEEAHEAQQQLSGLMLRAQDDERRRIARDLHDVTVQDVATMKADLSRLMRSMGPGAAGNTLSENVALADKVIKDLRTLSYLLHPPILDQAGLTAALQWLARGFSERSGIRVELQTGQGIGRLAADAELALFRVVQESLTNIHRHSGSATATIELTMENGVVLLRISDQGRGFATLEIGDGEVSSGVGILGMRQRLKQLGGDLEIRSSENGTTVTARISTTEEQYAAISGSR
jgi:signal transduction histidine kinase